MLPYRWMLAFGLGLVAIGGAAVGGAASPRAGGPSSFADASADPLATLDRDTGSVAKAAPHAATERAREIEPRVVVGAAVLRVYDEAGRVIYEE